MVSDSENPRIRYRRELELISNHCSDSIEQAIQEFLDVYDPDLEMPQPPAGEETKAETTLYNYARDLRYCCQFLDSALMDCTAEEINRTMKSLYKGTHPDLPDSKRDEGYSANYVRTFQNVLIKFYRFHDGPVDPEDIFRYSRQSTGVDERDMFSAEDIEAMREAIDHPRDRAIFELLLNTGQRISAIQKLRIKDIDVEGGVLYLNHKEGQHKNARGKRPLLGAESACREWLKYHPCKDDPEAYFITQRQEYKGPKKDPGSQLHTTNISRVVRKIADKAGVDKQTNPHAFRHNFATICAEDHNMSPDTIKRLLGHSEKSTTFEETYKHISDSTYVEKAQLAAGVRDEDEPNQRLAPKICDCGQALAEDAKACPSCGVVYAPDAKATQEKVEELALDGMEAAEDTAEADAVKDFRQFLKKNPEEAVDILREEL